jgi:1-aminocyclopropane-1-carboxylate deaminase/D-cysteine desulfhydrase-like pyridoxal-dependent ACC family enzyme
MTRRIPTSNFIPLARGPTPVERLGALSAQGAELWVKRDDQTHPVYGGNKVRKLEWLLADAVARGAKRIVTIGAVGSHHVLATTYFAREQGLQVEAVLVPQPRTDHVVEVLRAGLGLGLRPHPVGSWAAVPVAVAGHALRGAYVVPIGGSNTTGSMGYVVAARELAGQIRAGAMPEPDVCVVALGSGGTAAGLAAGFAAEGLRTRVVGVCVSEPPWLLRYVSLRLAGSCARRIRGSGEGPRSVSLTVDARFLGPGYGHPTREGDEATALARQAGLELDPTYTAKAFACALWYVRARRERVILYWHTLSSAPLAPLLERAPTEDALPPRLKNLAT